MGIFKSYYSFEDFEHSVTRVRRYMRTSEQEEFLKAVLETSQSRREDLAAGSLLWRAQIGHGWALEEGDGEIDKVPCPFPFERMKPLRYQASEGRANPKGIPVLYTATHQSTAIAEVRPWVGLRVSVAQMKVLRPLTLINCTMEEENGLKVYGLEPKPEERERAVWRNINRAFSWPVNPNDYLADYPPTQIIAELFKEISLDGIAYGSSLGLGHNVAIFDLDAAKVECCKLVHIEGVEFKTSEDDPYPY
jgi:RES domain